MAVPECDRGRLVSINADNCPLCMQTMRIFTATYGAEAGVAGLKWLPQGGTQYLHSNIQLRVYLLFSIVVALRDATLTCVNE